MPRRQQPQPWRRLSGRSDVNAPQGFRVDTFWRFCNWDPASRMQVNLAAEDSRSSQGSGPATRPRCKGKAKTRERPRRLGARHPHDSNPVVTCSVGDGHSRQPRHDPTGWKVGAPRAGGVGGNDPPPSSGGEGPPSAYRSRESSRESTPGQLPGPPGGGPPRGLLGRGPLGGTLYGGPPDRGPPWRTTRWRPPDEPPGGDDPKDIWR